MKTKTTLAAALLAAIAPLASSQNRFDAPWIPLPAGSLVAQGDLDGDGDTDIVTLAFSTLGVLINDGTGTFSPGPTLSTAPGTSLDGRPRLADLNGDSDLDLVTFVDAGGPGTGLYVYFGGAGASFQPAAFAPTPSAPSHIDIADYNGDQRDDIAVSMTFGAMRVGWVFHNGVTFKTSNFIPFGGEFPGGVVAFDHTGDGLADMAVIEEGDVELVFVPTVAGQPTLGASLQVMPVVSNTTPNLVSGDIDGDGDEDIVAVRNTSIDILVSVVENQGVGFAVGPTVELPNVGFELNTRGMVLGDIDGDGDLDIGTQTLLLLFGQGRSRAFFVENTTGSLFGDVHEIPVSGLGYAPGFADLDGDANLDFVGAGTVIFGDGSIPTFGGGFVPGSTGTRIFDEDDDGDLDMVLSAAFYENDGTGAVTFSGSVFPDPGVGLELRAGIRGDFDGDGRRDLVAELWQPSGDVFVPDTFIEMRLLKGEASGAFVDVGPATLAGLVIGGLGTQTGDFDDDGDNDIMTSNTLWRNGGAGFFGTAIAAPPGTKHDRGDVDGDGRVDVIARDGNTLSVHRNLGGGAFASTPLLTFTSIDFGSRLIDLDDDGDLDVAASTTVSNPFGDLHTVRLFENNGSGTFTGPIDLSTFDVEPDLYGAADVDGDGLSDLLVSSTNNDSAATSEDNAFGPRAVLPAHRGPQLRSGRGLHRPPQLRFRRHRLRRRRRSARTDAAARTTVRKSRRRPDPSVRPRQTAPSLALSRRVVVTILSSPILATLALVTAGAGGAVPLLGAQGPAKLGSTSYQLRLRRGLGGAPTLIAIGTDRDRDQQRTAVRHGLLRRRTDVLPRYRAPRPGRTTRRRRLHHRRPGDRVAGRADVHPPDASTATPRPRSARRRRTAWRSSSGADSVEPARRDPTLATRWHDTKRRFVRDPRRDARVTASMSGMNERQIEYEFRRMTPAERWRVWLELTRLADRLWEDNLSPEEIRRRWEIWRRQHDLSDRRMLAAFRKAQ